MVAIPEVKSVPVESLTVDGHNPNVMPVHKFEALKRNLKKFGFIVPIITNKEGMVADGEHRLKAAKDLGMQEVPVIKLDVKEVDRRMLRQILNKLRGEHMLESDVEEFNYLMQMDAMEEFKTLLPDDYDDLIKQLSLEDAFGRIPNGAKGNLVQSMFTLEISQENLLNACLATAKEDLLMEDGKKLNDNSNANALWVICKRYEEWAKLKK